MVYVIVASEHRITLVELASSTTGSPMTEKRILVTGATGAQGGALIPLLMEQGFQVRALTRNPDKPSAQALARKGAEVVAGDLDDGVSLQLACQGCYGVFCATEFLGKRRGLPARDRPGHPPGRCRGGLRRSAFPANLCGRVRGSRQCAAFRQQVGNRAAHRKARPAIHHAARSVLHGEFLRAGNGQQGKEGRQPGSGTGHSGRLPEKGCAFPHGHH
ncbi:MAG: hypothetical protein CL552_03580 [Alcanivorax sp.]|nr:hypothetical protein [Alcanivorax sp.]